MIRLLHVIHSHERKREIWGIGKKGPVKTNRMLALFVTISGEYAKGYFSSMDG